LIGRELSVRLCDSGNWPLQEEQGLEIERR
jgi:hypothetical protein